MNHLRDAWALLTQKERLRALYLTGLTLLGAGAEALGIGLVFPFISLLGNPEPIVRAPLFQAVYQWSGAATLEGFVLVGALALIAIYIVKNLFLSRLYVWQARFVCGIEARLATDLLASYIYAPYVARLGRNSSDQLRMITAEVGRATAGFIMPVIALLTETLVLTAIAVLLLVVQPVVTLAAFAIIGVSGYALLKVFKRGIATQRELRNRSGTDMFKWASQGMGALKEMKVLGREDHFVSRFDHASRGYAQATAVFNSMNLMPRLAVETMAVCALLASVAIALATQQRMDQLLPMLTLFGLAAVRVMPSATRMVGAVNNVRYYGSAVTAVAEDLRRAGTAARDARRRQQNRARHSFQRLELQNVSFNYPNAADASLKNVTLALRRGEMVAMVGASGSGKTTLGDLILGLLAPQSGTLSVNGSPTQALHDEWPGISALVPQDFFVLDDSIRRNVAFGIDDADIDDERVWRALRLARLEARVRELPQGLESLVGERGALLSGGERQRLSIGRALYDDPDILVLDEATSALDPTTESQIVETLQSLAGHKTVLLITHRLAAALRCERVIVMQGGAVLHDSVPSAAPILAALEALSGTPASPGRA